MSTYSAITQTPSMESVYQNGVRPVRAAGAAAALAVLGLSTIWPVMNALRELWMGDDLKSVGMFFPLISFILVLCAWRSIEWEMDGSWWGLAVLMVTVLAVRMRDQAVLVLVLSPQWSVVLPPPSLMLFAYGCGVALLFGGPRLVRASIFPLALLWFANPVPHIFNVFVDLPLQHASAHVARAFAIALGQPLTQDQLRLMFTPQFGMFIAPGCNGIRGAVTMGFIALIAGYVYRFRWYAHAIVVAGAILLGYLFNFVRLCLLVLYYLVALHITWLQHRAKMGDYLIGGTLFLVGTMLLFYVIGKLAEEPRTIKSAAISDAGTKHTHPSVPSSFFLRSVVMILFAVFGCYGVARAYARSIEDIRNSQQSVESSAAGKFPQHLGTYALSRSWNEKLLTGVVLYHWAEYISADRSTSVAVGVAPGMGAHDTLVCHSARGEDPLWRGELSLSTSGGLPVSFSGAIFNNGATQYLEATTICNDSSCGEYTSERRHFGLVYSNPGGRALLSPETHRPIPILMRVETTDTTLPVEVAQQKLTATLRSFVGSLDVEGLTTPYRRP